MRQRLQARIDMLMENIALRHQLMVYERGRTARRSLSGNDRLLWCFLARFFSNWRDTLDIVQPATVTRWRRVRWWRHLLGGRRRRPGRPRIDPELQALILRMARENPRWGSMRILGELRHLGFELSNSTVRRYRGSAGDPALVDVLPEPRAVSRRGAARGDDRQLAPHGYLDRFTAATEGLGAQASDEDRDALRASGLGHVSRILAALGSTEAGDGGLAGACTRRPNGPAEGRLTRGWNIGAPRSICGPDHEHGLVAQTGRRHGQRS